MKRPVDKKEFGKRLRARREKMGYLKLKPFAEGLGIQYQTMQNWEYGKVSSTGQLRIVAKKLDTSEEWLLYKEGPEEVPRQRSSSDDDLHEFLALWRSLAEDRRRLLLRVVRVFVDEAA